MADNDNDDQNNNNHHPQHSCKMNSHLFQLSSKSIFLISFLADGFHLLIL